MQQILILIRTYNAKLITNCICLYSFMSSVLVKWACILFIYALINNSFICKNAAIDYYNNA